MNILKKQSFFICLVLIAGNLLAQKTVSVSENLTWNVVQPNPGDIGKPYITFDKATVQNVASSIPSYSYIFEHGFEATVTASINVTATAPLTPAEMALVNPADIPVKFSPIIYYFTQNRKPASRALFVPMLKVGATIVKITSFTLSLTATPTHAATTDAAYAWADNSVLQNGKWARLVIGQTGIHKLGVGALADVGIDAEGADVNKIRLYGNGGAMLNQKSADPKTDDLIENAIEVKDLNGNGKFDGDDHIIFYAEGANVWTLDTPQRTYRNIAHRYADKNYYYITVGAQPGRRVASQPEDAGTPNYTTTTFDELYYYENDLINFLKSGREWFGEEFDKKLSYDFNVPIADLVTGETVKIRSQSVGRCLDTGTMVTTCNGQNVMAQGFNPVYFDYEYNFIDYPYVMEGSCTAVSSPLTINYTFNRFQTSSKSWLNFFEVVARRQMRYNGKQVIFRDSRNILGSNLTEFVFDDNGENIRIWEVTNHLEVKQQQTRKNGQQHKFALQTPQLRTFVAFNDNALLEPEAVEKVENQNLHGLRNIDMIIISHPAFLQEAQRLADHRRDNDGLTVAVVTPQQIYHEFSSGKQDVSAIRNFMKMLYDRPVTAGDNIKYLLMFGDASYDYKNRLKNNTNLVPTYQSRNMYSPVFSYCSDDYFTHLDDDEGEYDENGKHETIDIGVGRIPVQTEEQARQMVDKILSYTHAKTFGEWRNNVCFIADDEDSNIHFDDAQIYSTIVENRHREYNVDKIYMDAFKQVSVGNGARYPEVNNLLNRKVKNGALIINYSGHGGEQGLTHEQILDVPMVNAWDNKYNLPLFVTATCEFSRFDDPGRTSAGELVLLNPNGGGIGLLTTVRLVYQYPNRLLNTKLYDNNVFSLHNGEIPRLGDVFKRTKNGAPDLNNRNFTLLGDPSVTLNYPYHNVATTEVNGNATGTSSDTANALSKVTVKGEVQDAQGNRISGFNGVVYPIVFDKLSELSTLANDPKSLKVPFTMYKNIIYKGKATVNDGRFEFSFIVPKDISYALGNSKISYYATNNTTDAHGYYDSLVVTGTDNAAPKDVKGPTVRLYMNDTTFRYGGITDENPTLLALVGDLHGINTTGNGIGRDLTAVLDGDRSSMVILNDYYQARLDSYTEGEIRYPLNNLSEGLHNIRVKVWDVYNNSAEGYTEFVVANSEKLAIKNLINYPNPFNEKTTFYFEHNREGAEMYIDVEILNLSGQVLKTMSAYVPSANATFDGLEWNVNNDFVNIAQGIYLFRVKVRSGNDTVEETQKMVFIK